jgi:maltooligosyltrehalose trehalohydrolase
VRAGRRAEFAEHGWAAEEVPDPQDPATFERSKLRWEELGDQSHAELLSWHKALIRLRHSSGDLNNPQLDHVLVDYDESARWLVIRRGRMLIAVNLGSGPQAVPVGKDLTVLLASREYEQKDSSILMAGESVVIAR